MQKKRIASFKPIARAPQELGPGVRAGTPKQVMGDPSGSADKQISIKDDIKDDE
jgi:hypothetical protein